MGRDWTNSFWMKSRNLAFGWKKTTFTILDRIWMKNGQLNTYVPTVGPEVFGPSEPLSLHFHLEIHPAIHLTLICMQISYFTDFHVPEGIFCATKTKQLVGVFCHGRQLAVAISRWHCTAVHGRDQHKRATADTARPSARLATCVRCLIAEGDCIVLTIHTARRWHDGSREMAVM